MKDSRLDSEIIKQIKEGINVSENFKIISERHSGIFYKMAHKYISKKFKEKKLDFLRDKNYYIYLVILDFDETKQTKFSTYLGNRIKWMCMNDYNKTISNFEVNCNEDVFKNYEEKSQTDYSSIIDAINVLKKQKDTRVFRIFQLRYLEGKKNNLMPWKDVCQDNQVQLSVQGCINVHNKFINKIRKEK